MTPVVVLFGAGIGVGIALIVSGLWSTSAPVKRASMMKRLDPANRQAALCAVALALIVGLIIRWPVGAAIGGALMKSHGVGKRGVEHGVIGPRQAAEDIGQAGALAGT